MQLGKFPLSEEVRWIKLEERACVKLICHPENFNYERISP
jgi:hypothetical protein